jgi:hypothetical protein
MIRLRSTIYRHYNGIGVAHVPKFQFFVPC